MSTKFHPALDGHSVALIGHAAEKFTRQAPGGIGGAMSIFGESSLIISPGDKRPSPWKYPKNNDPPCCVVQPLIA